MCFFRWGESDECWEQFWTADNETALYKHVFSKGFCMFEILVDEIISRADMAEEPGFKEAALRFITSKAKEKYSTEYIAFKAVWSVSEHEKLQKYVLENGIDNWTHEPFPDASTISSIRMRLRYESCILPKHNELNWTDDEDKAILAHVRLHGQSAWDHMDMDVGFDENVTNLQTPT